MYTTCLHCHRDLGTNESLEAFPVGKRVAFDGAKGRLWAVCPHCGRWNLAPLEDRWEAIEAAERLFRGTRIRASTDNIGLARLRDGTELVRIGEALRPEFAAWRYTNHIVRRRRTALALGAATTVGIGAATFGLVGAVGASGGGWWIFQGLRGIYKTARDRRVVHRIPRPEGQLIIRHGDLWRVEWIPARDQEPPRLRLYDIDPKQGDGESLGISYHTRRHLPPLLDVSGDDAVALGAPVLARLNRRAGSRQHIADALRWLDVFGNPFTRLEAPPVSVLALPDGMRDLPHVLAPFRSADGRASEWPPYLRLAFEMAAHEEQERLYLASHLSLLAEAWKEAEAIARIADDLLLPEWIQRRMPG